MKVENDMDYKIIADSCCDLTDEMKDWGNLALVPLTLELGDYRIMDDENFDQDVPCELRTPRALMFCL